MVYEMRRWKMHLRSENKFVIDLYSQKGFLKSLLTKYLTLYLSFPSLGVHSLRPSKKGKMDYDAGNPIKLSVLG